MLDFNGVVGVPRDASGASGFLGDIYPAWGGGLGNIVVEGFGIPR